MSVSCSTGVSGEGRRERGTEAILRPLSVFSGAVVAVFCCYGLAGEVAVLVCMVLLYSICTFPPERVCPIPRAPFPAASLAHARSRVATHLRPHARLPACTRRLASRRAHTHMHPCAGTPCDTQPGVTEVFLPAPPRCLPNREGARPRPETERDNTRQGVRAGVGELLPLRSPQVLRRRRSSRRPAHAAPPRPPAFGVGTTVAACLFRGVAPPLHPFPKFSQ